MSRFGSEQDPNIEVEVTSDSVDHCFRVTLGNVKVLMHARSVVDLIHKLEISVLDWIATETKGRVQ